MATTPNYGWVTPAPTDFVVDLPADFETFADAVDADLAGLLGGTTGQLLTKNSNADHDFSWTTVTSGGWTQLATGNFPTNALTATISGISTSYKNLRLILRDVSFVADGNLRCRINADGTQLYQTVDTYTGTSNIADDASINIATIDAAAGDGIQILDFPNYADTTCWKLFEFQTFARASDGTNFFGRKAAGGYRSTNAITSLQIYNNTNNSNFSAGNYILLGGN